MSTPPKRTLTHIEHDGFRELKERFDEAHAEGKAALQRKDYRALEVALRREREILNEQRQLILFRIHRHPPPRAGRK